MHDTAKNNSTTSQEEPTLFDVPRAEVELNEFDADAAETELRLGAADIDVQLAKLDEGQFVSHDTMLLEFSI